MNIDHLDKNLEIVCALVKLIREEYRLVHFWTI